MSTLNNLRVKSILRLIVTIGSTLVAIKARKPELRGTATLASLTMITFSWWKNNTMTKAAEQGQQMVDSIKTAARYRNTADMIDPTAEDFTIAIDPTAEDPRLD